MRTQVILSADDRFSAQLGTTIFSLLINTKNPENIHITILDGGLKTKNKEKLYELVAFFKTTLEFSDNPKDLYKNFSTSKKELSTATFYRISIPDIISEKVKKAVYIDCDLIFESDIAELFEYNLTDKQAVGAIEDISRTPAYELLGIPKTKYFNAGVLLINLEHWRKNNISSDVQSFLLEKDGLLTSNDQCALNAILWNKWRRLPLQWNAQSGIYKRRLYTSPNFGYSKKEFLQAIYNPKIIHYVGTRKPWTANCPHPLKSRYYYYNQQTSWSEPSTSKLETIRIALESKKIHHFIHGYILKEKIALYKRIKKLSR